MALMIVKEDQAFGNLILRWLTTMSIVSYSIETLKCGKKNIKILLISVSCGICLNIKYDFLRWITNLLLTEREGRTGEYWPEVVAVRTERSEVRTKTTEGQYSPVRLEQARLVSSLLYGFVFLG